MNAIETKNLTKKFKEHAAVRSLNLSIAQGEFFSLLGVNGAGKTTTIRMLTCLTLPTSGDATLLGKSIVTQAQEVKSLINLSPQETAVAPNLTVRENLEMIAGIYGYTSQAARVRAAQMMETLALGKVESKKAKLLSGGWQRRLSIAMSLISDPKVLFLDEPTLGLDVLARRELWEVIEILRGKVTLVLTTHYLEEAQAISDRIGIMAQGELKALGTVTELLAQTGANNFEDAFVAIATKSEQLQ